MSKTIEQIRAELDAKIPRDVISQREGGGRSKLSYLEGHYVIDRLNKVLGQGMWEYNAEEMRLVHSGEVGDKQVAHYIAKVCLTVYGLREGTDEVSFRTSVSFSDYGYGDGSDKYNPGKAHELAVKEAVTDGLKRCAKSLGMSMGLALYDKTQENVDDGEEAEPVPSASPTSRVPATVTPIGGGTKETKSAAPVAKEGAASSDDEFPEAPPENREKMIELIGFMSKVISTKRIKTIPELRTLMTTKYGADSKEKLSDAAAQKCYVEFRGMIA